MGRRSTPERIFQAKRAAIIARLEGQGWSRETAEEWCTRWEAVSDGRHAHDYWQQGAAWIAEQRRR